MKAKRTGKWFVFAGLLLIAVALCLTVYNIHQQTGATHAATDALRQIEIKKAERAEAPQPEIPAYLKDPNTEMPRVEIDGELYFGIIDIPALELRLPVINEWSYDRLKIAPCRFQGSAYLGDLIIMAHNYTGHFGRLGDLRPGDEVYFEDMDGNVFGYQVVELETLDGTAAEDMVAGDWELTLFTCTISGKSRVTVRCEEIERE